MPVMRVSEAAVEAVVSWARPLENRPHVVDRIVKVATEGPPKDWLADVLGEYLISMNGPVYMEDVQDLAQHLLDRWPGLREHLKQERLGPDPEEGGGEP